MSDIVKKEPTIKDILLSKGTIDLFASNLPNAVGKHAEEAATRFAKMVYTVISQNALLQSCTPASIVKAASVAASLQLDIDVRGLAYLVPYGKEAQFQIGYMGLIELAYRSGEVKAISAHCIYQSELDKVVIERSNGKFSVHHPFSFNKPSGDIVAVYACAEIYNLGTQTIVMRIDEIEKIRKCSKAPDSPAWKNHYEAMAKKTAIRQLAKFLPKSIIEDFSRAAAEDEQQEMVDIKTVSSQVITENTAANNITINGLKNEAEELLK